MKNVIKLTVLAGVISAYGVAGAQQMKPLGMSIRAGLFFPTSSVAQAAGNSWFGGGFDYKISDAMVAGMGNGYQASMVLSVDLLSKGNFRSIPVTYNWVGRKDKMYYLAGAGVSFTKSGSSSTTEFAYQVGLGMDIPRGSMPLFVEAKWMGNGNSDLSGWGLFVGVRF